MSIIYWSRVAELRAEGIAHLGCMPWATEFIAALDAKTKLPGHAANYPRPGIFHHSMVDVMEAPHFLQYAKSLTPTASAYFNEIAVLWSLNVFHTEPGTPFLADVHGLHRDAEAPKILVLFMLCRDTDADGAQLLQHPNEPHRWHAIYGPAGTAWLADTSFPHLGLIPNKPRSIAWARFANIRPSAADGLPIV